MTPLLLFALAWVSGVWIAQAFVFPLIWLLLLIPLTLVLCMGWKDNPLTRWLPWACAGLLLGVGRLLLAQPVIDEEHIAFYNDVGQVEIEGVIVGEPDPRPYYTGLRVRVETAQLPNAGAFDVHGVVLVKIPAHSQVHYGDRIVAVGNLRSPPVFESFDYRSYLERQGIHSILCEADATVVDTHQANPFFDVLYRFKAHALKVLLSLLPEPQASLLAGILLGVERGIPDDLKAAFATTGTSHIVAISGFNLTLIAGVFAALARRFLGRRAEAPLGIAGIWLYTLLVGASSAVLRAALMATTAVVGRAHGRRTHGPTSLAGAVWVMTLINPYLLWDVGFQLSVAATAGLVLYTDPLTAYFKRWLSRLTHPERAEQIVGWLSDAVIVTLAAQLTTMPVLVATFRTFSVVSLFTNFLILPVQSFVMLWGGVALIAGLIVHPIGQVFAWIAWVFLSYTIAMVRWTATFPFASLPLEHMTLTVVWGYYAVLGAVSGWLNLTHERRDQILRMVKSFAQWQFAAVTAALVLVFACLSMLPDGRLHVYVLDVTRGDAIFIKTPSGKQILVDGGQNASQMLSKLGPRMPFWDHRLDMAIVTSPDEERLAGIIAVLERYEVDFLGFSLEQGTGAVYDRWLHQISERQQYTMGALRSGMDWDLDKGVKLRVLWPGTGNTDGPLVIQLCYGDTEVLLPGGITTVVEQALVSNMGDDLHSTILLLPRHGAKTSATRVFLQAVDPEAIVISVGLDEGSDVPASTVLARVMDKPIYRTDYNGVVEIVSDGSDIRIHTERHSSGE